VNNESISKYELLQLFNKHFKDNALIIHPDDKYSVDKSLLSNRDDFSFKVPGYEEMVVEMKDWVYNHKDIYPHYFK
jgi:dTDP-4-dehydrorhamnose reductase